MTPSVFNANWVLLVGIATVSFVAVDRALPGAGLAIAGSVALFWAIDSGAVSYLANRLGHVRRAAMS